MDSVLLGAVSAFLMIPSLIFNALYALGPVIAPILGLALVCAFPFIALRDKKGA